MSHSICVLNNSPRLRRLLWNFTWMRFINEVSAESAWNFGTACRSLLGDRNDYPVQMSDDSKTFETDDRAKSKIGIYIETLEERVTLKNVELENF